MNKKEAKEIVNLQGHSKGNLGTFPLVCEAKGYLEAIEKAKVLVEALEELSDGFDPAVSKITNEALAQWEKEK